MAFFETVLIRLRYIFKAASAFIKTKPGASELEIFQINHSWKVYGLFLKKLVFLVFKVL